MRRNNKRDNLILILIILLGSIGIGYAFLTQELTINGTGKVNANSWNIYFDNLVLNEDNVELSSGNVEATINPTTNTDVSFTVTFNNPGEFYEFTVDAVNDGSMDAMIGVISNKFNGEEISETNPLPDYVNYKVTYIDDVELSLNQLLAASTSETFKVRLEYKKDITADQLPTTNQSLTFNFGVKYVQADSNAVINVPHPETLYGVLEAEAQAGVYATTYTGEHQDSFTNTGTKNIYHWYATSDEVGTQILDKNNVRFAGQCWQMIRTTDTGGVKLLYNGEAENNQCLNTRGTHIGYGDRAHQTLNSSYYYGSDYTYDATNNVFALSGTVEQSTWNATTGPTLIGKYTCKSASETGTCATLYLIESYNSATSAYAFPIKKTSHYSQFGRLAYNNNYNSPAYVGYMYNDVYPVTKKSSSNSFTVTSSSSWTVNTSYYYSDTIDWNTTTSNQYTLLNPHQLSTLSGDYSSLIGKYVIRSTNATNSSTVSYITAVNSNKLYYKDLTNGDLNISLTIGDSYTESGGVYTLSGNVTNVPYQTWYNSTSLGDYKGKYVCDGNNTSCTNIKHINTSSNPSKRSYSYFDSANAWQYAESVSYNGTSYTLSGDIKALWDYFDTSVQTTITTHHYTCLNNGTSCTTVGYINYLDGLTLYYAQLTGVSDIETAVNNMLYASNVNTKNSPIKSAIDAWYEKYLSGYDTYLEDTIFCNDRTIKSLGGWDPDGGGITSSSNFLQFQEYSLTKDLSCDRETDQFSTLNNSAKLTYKVGLMSSPEMNLLNNNTIRNTGEYFWLVSPLSFSNALVNVKYVYSTGEISNTHVGYFGGGLRPAVSILPGTVYTSGDGSMASPYTIE